MKTGEVERIPGELISTLTLDLESVELLGEFPQNTAWYLHP